MSDRFFLDTNLFVYSFEVALKLISDSFLASEPPASPSPAGTSHSPNPRMIAGFDRMIVG
jgi:hypothetical protein